MKTERRPRLMAYALIGLVFAIGPFFWNVDAGDRVLGNAEAWEAGWAPLTVAQGALLLFLVAILWRGALWPRWPIVVWCPVGILSNAGLSIATGIGKIEPFEAASACIVMFFWVWASRRYLFKDMFEKSNETLSSVFGKIVAGIVIEIGLGILCFLITFQAMAFLFFS
jgi:hypothetical protein